MIRVLTVGLGMLALAGCTTMQVQQFAGGSPSMSPDAYFPGHATSYGIFIDRFGNIRNQFTVDCDSTWDGQTLVLHEQFHYVGGANGQPSFRVWHFHKTGPDTWLGSANDTIGDATGVVAGNAFHIQYHVLLHQGTATHEVAVSDWMLRSSDKVMVNHTVISKLGITLGDVQIAFVHE